MIVLRYIALFLMLTILAACQTAQEFERDPLWAPDVYKGDHYQKALIHATRGDAIPTSSDIFDQFFCVDKYDFYRLYDGYYNGW